jgi:hypothetical protein
VTYYISDQYYHVERKDIKPILNRLGTILPLNVCGLGVILGHISVHREQDVLDEQEMGIE